MIDQVLRNRGAELAVTFFIDGVPTDADGPVTVSVFNPDGTPFDDPVTADDAVPGDGTYEYDLVPQSDLTKLRLEWAGEFDGVTEISTTFVEIVGAFLFTVAQARAFRNGKLADVDKYPTQTIVEVREEITEQFEQYTRVSFVPRYRREVIDGNGREAIYLDRHVINNVQRLTEDGVELTEGSGFHTYRSGRLVREGTWSAASPHNIVVDYEHGYSIPPGPISRAGLIVLHSLIIGSDIMDRKIIHQDETGMYRLSMPDAKDRPTGIPLVDARLNEYVDPWGVS